MTVHDRGDTEGTLWIATQFIDGTKIGEVVEVTPVMTRATKQLVFMRGIFTL